MTGDGIIVRRAYSECRFGQMHYLEGRPKAADRTAAPPLVLLHQNPSTSVEYDKLLRAMAVDRRVIAFDTPGYGMSDPPPEPLSAAAYAAAFSDAIDALGLAKTGCVDVYGYHTGTVLAAELAIQRPDLIGRVALSGVPMRTPEECAERLRAARGTPGPTEDGAGILAQSAALWRYVVAQRHPDVPLDRAVTLYAEKNKPLHRGWWAYEGVWSYAFAERFPLITQPVLFAQPHEALLEASRAACALAPDSVFVELPDLDRDIFEVGVDRLTPVLRNFFSSLAAPAAVSFAESPS